MPREPQTWRFSALCYKKGSQQDHYDLCLPHLFLLHSREHFRDIIPYSLVSLAPFGGCWGWLTSHERRVPSNSPPHPLLSRSPTTCKWQGLEAEASKCELQAPSGLAQRQGCRCLVPVSAWTTITVKVSRGFPHSPQVNAWIKFRLIHDRFLPNIFQATLICHPVIRYQYWQSSQWVYKYIANPFFNYANKFYFLTRSVTRLMFWLLYNILWRHKDGYHNPGEEWVFPLIEYKSLNIMS